MAAGIITPNSLFVQQGGRMARLPITRTPLVQLEATNDETVQADTTPTEQEHKPVFSWTDETLGGPWDSSGNRHWNWSQSETDWIRTGC